MPQLLAIAEYITKTLAICVVCGNPADRTQRKGEQHERVVVGAKDLYEARCRFAINLQANKYGARSICNSLIDKKLITEKKIQDALSFIRGITDFKPQIALILGSGLGEFSKNIKIVSSILASEIPNYPVSCTGACWKINFRLLAKGFY